MTERSLLFLYGNSPGDREVRVPGVQSTQRFAALKPDFAKAFPPPPAPYLAIGEFDGEPDAVSGASSTDAVGLQVWAPHKGRIANESATPRDERGRYLVFGNCVAGQEEVYTEWYDNTHLSEVLAVPGVLSAQRYTLAEPEFTKETPVTHRYLALYEFEGDADAVMVGMRAKTASGEMVMHDSLDLETVTMSFWAPRGPKVEAGL